MVMRPNQKGFYDEKTAIESMLPIFDYEDPDVFVPVTLFSYTDMKEILEIRLTDFERLNYIEGFEKSSAGFGYIPLYSYTYILKMRSMRDLDVLRDKDF